ncbi:GntR family transcriptional regulator [Pandoraea commovens]|uniref:GntR family transcriptional regulator n=1 Tax=Pandoraea commovens TaxID=2508289 RepID=A0A5E4XRM5_9BURK|nr:GntR family transcriptional regulator [Pandoraea commovens]UVA80903.1 GntR family transcriptional regulator [Pandoraea commovens]VVE38986.1 HTH-type transcriptional regulator LutR [Pandoraea commovens]
MRKKAEVAQDAATKHVKGSGASKAYQLLRDRIVSLEMHPGDDIDEQALVDELGISRTPLREAMIRLAAEGLISILPNRGARVSSMDIPQLQEHLEAFELTQRATTRLAALRRTQADLARIETLVVAFETAHEKEDVNGMIDGNWELHLAIGNACGNRVLAKIYANLLTENLRIARLAMSYETFPTQAARQAHLNNILREHREILEAIRTRDAERADELAASHTNLARKRVTEYISLSALGSMTVGAQANVPGFSGGS